MNSNGHAGRTAIFVSQSCELFRITDQLAGVSGECMQEERLRAFERILDEVCGESCGLELPMLSFTSMNTYRLTPSLQTFCSLRISFSIVLDVYCINITWALEQQRIGLSLW